MKVLGFETDLEDKLGQRGPQCSAGPSPSAYSRSALPACGAESRTSGSEAEPEKQGQKLPSLATTPGWTFVFFQKLEVHEVHQKLEYWFATVCMQSMQSIQQYNMPFSQLSSVKFHHMRSVWYRKALVVICMFYEYVLCMFFLDSSITFTLFYWYMSWIIGQEYNSSLLFVENQNGQTKHHHKFYSQTTCPQFGVLKQRLLNQLPVRIKLKFHNEQ